jgi:hypothetical protein
MFPYEPQYLWTGPEEEEEEVAPARRWQIKPTRKNTATTTDAEADPDIAAARTIAAELSEHLTAHGLLFLGLGGHARGMPGGESVEGGGGEWVTWLSFRSRACEGVERG